jgi:hypothetical protein
MRLKCNWKETRKDSLNKILFHFSLTSTFLEETVRLNDRRQGFWPQNVGLQNLTLPLTSCVVLGKSSDLYFSIS